MNGKIPETDAEKVEYYEHMLESIQRVTENVPPYYAYGDNEAGCYMANMLQQIDEIIYNGCDFS
jgi:hypothetical protein